MRVKRIASVARIYISEEETLIAEQKLADVYEWIKEIKEISVPNVEPLYNVNENQYRTIREDTNPEFHSPSLILSNTPHRADNFIMVPKVIE